MFIGFFQTLRRHGVAATPKEWLTLMEALEHGLGCGSLAEFYHLARAVTVKDVALYDRFDTAFAEHFEGVQAPLSIKEEMWKWLEDPANQLDLEDLRRSLSKAGFDDVDLDRLREMFEKRLEEQTERHDGGSRWVGTRGRSPYGAFGEHKAGIRVGGASRSRSAVQVAAKRRFRNYRSDLVLDVRQIKMALRALRNLAREGPEELDLDATIDRTCKNAGDIDLAFARARKNTVKLMLLMDVGGSMTPHARLVSLLFSAAHASSHFKRFTHYSFHNCVYENLHRDIERRETVPTADVLRNTERDTRLVIVGDACMASSELTAIGGAIDYWERNRTPGIAWLRRLRESFPASIWLNPDPARYWDHYTVAAIANIFPMFELTLDGLTEAVHALKHARI